MAAYTHTTTRISRVLAGLAVLWGIIGLAGIESRADDGELARATLRGVEGVRVVVEELRPEVERTGLSRQQLQTDVELRLRKAGIRVLTKEERVPGRPWLYVNANVTVGASGIIAYQIDVGLRQNARLETDDSFAIAITWTYSTGMWVASTPTHVRNLVQDGVDHFINAYLSVHPRPAGSAISSSASPRRDLIRQVQERLQTVGYNPGTIDGAMGPQTKNALVWFQNAKGLRSTGDLDEPTLNALGIQ